MKLIFRFLPEFSEYVSIELDGEKGEYILNLSSSIFRNISCEEVSEIISKAIVHELIHEITGLKPYGEEEIMVQKAVENVFREEKEEEFPFNPS